MSDAIIRPDLAPSRRLHAALDYLSGSGRWYTSADVASGFVRFVGSCHSTVRDLNAKHWAPLLHNGQADAARRWAIRWRAIAPYAGQTTVGFPGGGGEVTIPSAPNGTIDETWQPVPPHEDNALPPRP